MSMPFALVHGATVVLLWAGTGGQVVFKEIAAQAGHPLRRVVHRAGRAGNER